MLLLDSARPGRKSAATSTLDLAELQQENGELVAELRQWRRRRRARRIRRLSIIGVPIGRAVAQRLAKRFHQDRPADDTPIEPERRSAGRVRILVFALVLRRLLESRTPKSAVATEPPTPAKVQ